MQPPRSPKGGNMSTPQILITILIIALATLLIRALPFLLFPSGKKTPETVSYLGHVLPYAAMAMLVVYCFRSVDPFSASHGLPELIAGLFVVIAHRWKHNMLLSIAGGTLLYMVLLRLF